MATRMVRETGPMSKLVPDFPLAAGFSAPLRAASEAKGSADFTPIWSGQSVHLARELPLKEITRLLRHEPVLAGTENCHPGGQMKRLTELANSSPFFGTNFLRLLRC